MEDKIKDLVYLNDSLIKEKDEIRNKIYEIIINCKCKELINSLHREEVNLFEEASHRFKDENFSNLLERYLNLYYISSSIMMYVVKEQEIK